MKKGTPKEIHWVTEHTRLKGMWFHTEPHNSQTAKTLNYTQSNWRKQKDNVARHLQSVRIGPGVFHISKEGEKQRSFRNYSLLNGLHASSPFFLVHPPYYHQRDPKLKYGPPPSKLNISNFSREKMPNVTNHQGTVNQNHSDILPRICWDGYY